MICRPRSLLTIVVPLLLGALLTLHPEGDGLIYDGVRDHVTEWLAVHIGLAIGVVLMALALHQLVRGLASRAATLTRAVLAPFVIAFLTWEGFTGIQTGLLVHEANGLPEGPEREAATANIQDHFTNPFIGDPSIMSMTANFGWVVAVIAAGIALRRAGAGTAPLVLLGLSTLFTAHSVILGTVGLFCFAAAAVVVARRQGRAPTGSFAIAQDARLA